MMLALLAAGCAHSPDSNAPAADSRCAPATPCSPCPTCPGQEPQAAGPAAAPLQASSWQAVTGWLQDDPAQAWPALRASCATLSRQAAWKPTCERAAALGANPTTQAPRASSSKPTSPPGN